MKRFLTLTAVCALGAAAPAAAQYLNGNAGGTLGIDNRIAQLETALQADVRAGVINRSEEYTLRRQLRDLRYTSDLYSRNGLTVRERSDLQARIRTIRQNIRLADGGRIDRYGYQDDVRGDVRGDVRDNGYYGQGGPYEDSYVDTCVTRGGIGGLVDSVVGNTCLRVGMRANSSLGAVPYEYRYRFRDGNGVYYRSDGRAIYEIDARTNNVVAVHGLNR